MVFNIPIETIENDYVDKYAINDLELLESTNSSETQDLATILYGKELCVENNNSIKTRLMTKYTTNEQFIINTQDMIEENELWILDDKDRANIKEANEAYRELKASETFLHDYQYFELPLLAKLNDKQSALQLLSGYNIIAPVLALITPIILLLIPFVIIKLQGHPVSLKLYLHFLKTIAGNHAIGNIFNLFQQVSFEKRIYIIIMIGFYFLQIYQNIVNCKTYLQNMKHIHWYFDKFKNFLAFHIRRIDKIRTVIHSKAYIAYNTFADQLDNLYDNTEKLYIRISAISNLKISIKKWTELGTIMQLWFDLKHDNSIDELMSDLFDLSNYISYINNISCYRNKNKLSRVDLYSDDIPIENHIYNAKGIYYPFYIANNNDIVRNNINITDKSRLITGPNASGKTTYIKSLLLNAILSQQIGMGCFERMQYKPYNKFHCHINTPDTAGRDSLFQAEARRCLDIITSVKSEKLNDKQERHLCIMDELYSGTNPYDAVECGYRLLDYISKQMKNMRVVVTTHYIDLCKKVDMDYIKNNKMEIKRKQNEWVPTYKIKDGISKVKAGMNILRKLNYPSPMLT